MGAQLTNCLNLLPGLGQGRTGGVPVQQRQGGLHGDDQEDGVCHHFLRDVVEGGQGQQTPIVTTR